MATTALAVQREFALSAKLQPRSRVRQIGHKLFTMQSVTQWCHTVTEAEAKLALRCFRLHFLRDYRIIPAHDLPPFGSAFFTVPFAASLAVVLSHPDAQWALWRPSHLFSTRKWLPPHCCSSRTSLLGEGRVRETLHSTCPLDAFPLWKVCCALSSETNALQVDRNLVCFTWCQQVSFESGCEAEGLDRMSMSDELRMKAFCPLQSA